MSGTAKSRLLRAASLKKFNVSGLTPAFPSTGDKRAGLIAGVDDGALYEAHEIGALVIELLEFCEIVFDLGDRVLLLSEIKQGSRSIATSLRPCQNWFVCRHFEKSRMLKELETPRRRSRSSLGIRWNEPQGSPRRRP